MEDNDNTKKKQPSKKYIIVGLLIIIIIIIIKFINSPDPNVIGLEILTDGASETKIRLKHFDDAKIAEEYFIDNGVEKYHIFIRTVDPRAKVWFENLDHGIMKEDGFKYLGFLGMGGKTSGDALMEFLFEENKLGKIKSYGD